MTREELIDFGEMFLEVNDDSKNSKTYKFIDAAVKLFKQEPTLDKISEEVDDLRNFSYPFSDILLDDVQKIINKYKVESECN